MSVQSSPRDLYKIKTIASLTGFNPTLLRAWERRYGLLVPTRTDTGHRLYTADDLRVLRRVRNLLDQGRSIGEIVAQGRSRLLSRDAHPMPGPSQQASTAFPLLESLREEILQAALSLDDQGIQRGLDLAFGSISAAQVLEHLVVPLAQEIGQLWARQLASVAAEHLLTQCLIRRLQRMNDLENRSGQRPLALCAGFPDEYHDLGLHLATYHLLHMGMQVLYLGPALPFEALATAVQVRRPQLVMLSVTRAALLEVHKPGLIQFAQTLSAETRLIVGGRAVKREEESELKGYGMILWPGEVSLFHLQESDLLSLFQ
ncbi:MAG: MerR family transcriptional regulator [Candidatus Eremiobacteraeota bacterium]|nr:MerR family transcriptional regulator [Candidatus Eremiobacteraeota bacterium]MCW5868705.1 MerR family transcriptional regulator [Candidatus Eremiobacteraeota bacterium]